MKTLIILITCFLLAIPGLSQKTNLPFKMEELTAPQFIKAVELAGGVCIIPLGIIEKHGPHLPIGTDLILAREVAFAAALREYAVIFPSYYFGQNFVAEAQPGGLGYSIDIMMKLLDETCSELSRNGLKKIILLNSHGGNTHFLEFFCQSQLMSRRDYSVILFQSTADPLDKEISSLKRTTVDGHAGEEETSMMYFLNPDYVDKSQIGTQSGADLDRLSEMKWGFTAIWWFAKFPNHYAGDGGQYNSHLGELLIKRESSQLADLISYLKRNNAIQTLQNEFYDKTSHPLKPR